MENEKLESLLNNNRNINPLKFKSKVKDYYCISIAGTDIFGKAKTNQDSFLSILNVIYFLSLHPIIIVPNILSHSTGLLISQVKNEVAYGFFLNGLLLSKIIFKQIQDKS